MKASAVKHDLFGDEEDDDSADLFTTPSRKTTGLLSKADSGRQGVVKPSKVGCHHCTFI